MASKRLDNAIAKDDRDLERLLQRREELLARLFRVQAQLVVLRARSKRRRAQLYSSEQVRTTLTAEELHELESWNGIRVRPAPRKVKALADDPLHDLYAKGGPQ